MWPWIYVDDADSKVVHAYVVTSDDIDIIKGTYQHGSWGTAFHCSDTDITYNFLVKPNIASFFVACQKHSNLGQICCVQACRKPWNQVPQT